MSAQYKLCDGLAACHFDGCSVLLDIPQDRYWMLVGSNAAALAVIARGAAQTVAPALIERLMAQGIIEPIGSSSSLNLFDVPDEPGIVRQTALVETASPTRNLDLLWAPEIAAAAFAARYWVRRVPLARLIEKVRHRRSLPHRIPEMPIGDFARLYDHYRRWVPLQRICLADSLAFLAIAARHGHYPQLMFGVIASPFAAHCWVQDEDMVLNDAIDRVTQFKLVLVV